MWHVCTLFWGFVIVVCCLLCIVLPEYFWNGFLECQFKGQKAHVILLDIANYHLRVRHFAFPPAVAVPSKTAVVR